MRRPDIPGVRLQKFSPSIPAGRSPVPKPFHHEAAARFWQENVGNSDSRISGDGVAAGKEMGFGGLAVNFVEC
jgi:hypothetical protein